MFTFNYICENPECSFETPNREDLFTDMHDNKLCRKCYCNEIQPGMNDTDFKFVTYPDDTNSVPEFPPIGGLFE